ncbi:MAG: PilZ domain-containing protein [Parcubacteria group bacterium]|jgi:hypothetical protein
MDRIILYPDDKKKGYVCCPRCGKCKGLTLFNNMHLIDIKCCGEVLKFKIEWRKNWRKEYEGFGTIGKKRVQIFDLSLGGMSFDDRVFDARLNSEVRISFEIVLKNGKTQLFSQTIKILSRKNNKYSAKFLDLSRELNVSKVLYSWLQERE